MPELPRAFSARPALLLHKLGNVLLERAEPRLARLGLTPRQYVILAILGTDQPASQVDLAALCSVAPAQMVGALDELEDAGLAERRRDEQDRRRSVVRLTTEGERVLGEADAVVAGLGDRVFAGATPQERERLVDLVRAAVVDLGVAG